MNKQKITDYFKKDQSTSDIGLATPSPSSPSPSSSSGTQPARPPKEVPVIDLTPDQQVWEDAQHLISPRDSPPTPSPSSSSSATAPSKRPLEPEYIFFTRGKERTKRSRKSRSTQTTASGETTKPTSKLYIPD